VRILRLLVILPAGLLALHCSIGDVVESSLRCDEKWLSARVTLAGSTDLHLIARGLRSRGYVVGEHLNVKEEWAKRMNVGKGRNAVVATNWIDVSSSQFGVKATVASEGTKTYVAMNSDRVHCVTSDQDLRRAGVELARDINLTQLQFAELQKHLEIEVKRRGLQGKPWLF
jgi:hypothetical protein